MSETRFDRTRAEGVHVSSSVYVGAVSLFLVERVNGDGTVDSVEVTRDEAQYIVEELGRELRDGPRGRYDQ